VDDLRERLRRLQRAYDAARKTGREAEGEPGSGPSSLREQLERIEQRGSRRLPTRAGRSERARPPRLEEVLHGTEVETPHGTCYEVKTAYRETFRHGDYPIGTFRDVDMGSLSLFCGGVDVRDAKAEDFLFMDLETTGLSLGTGTYGFLVGLGYFREGTYHIHQLFLRDFAEEPALLDHVRRIMAPFRHLVTFNGKSFDIPLLEARFSMCSQHETLREMVPWDLLYPARRLWYDRLEDCRLETIERERLGVAREGQDIAGEKIPRAYFRYVHEGNARDMDRIVYHNAMDVLTMTSLAIHIDESLREKDPARTNLFSVGKYYEKQGIQGVGAEFFEAASSRGPSHPDKDRALFHLARQHRRDGRFEEAVRIWRGLVEREVYGSVACCVEIAKHLEHRTREYDEAIGLVLHALERAGPEEGRVRADLEKRLSRLRRKKGRA
jgi:uncharacterized protein YprB with RNaseH-like and TPR domain